MKLKFPALLLLTGFAFSACQKEVSYEVPAGTAGGSGNGGGGGSSSGYYIKGKKDGTAFTFTANALAVIVDYTPTLGAGVGLGMHASPTATGIEALNITIVLSTGNTVPTGTYSESNNGGFTQITTGTYIINSNLAWVAGVDPSPALPLKVVIQTKTSSVISGTFEGAFYKSDGAGNTTSEHITITEGSFNLPVQ